MPIEYDPDHYFEIVKERDEAICHMTQLDRLERRLIRLEMLIRFLVDKQEGK
jgi:hypothetical protein